MNKKAIALALALLALMAAAIVGLPLMTRRMEAQRMDMAVYVTATPAPDYDEDGYNQG